MTDETGPCLACLGIAFTTTTAGTYAVVRVLLSKGPIASAGAGVAVAVLAFLGLLLYSRLFATPPADRGDFEGAIEDGTNPDR